VETTPLLVGKNVKVSTTERTSQWSAKTHRRNNKNDGIRRDREGGSYSGEDNMKQYIPPSWSGGVFASQAKSETSYGNRSPLWNLWHRMVARRNSGDLRGSRQDVEEMNSSIASDGQYGSVASTTRSNSTVHHSNATVTTANSNNASSRNSGRRKRLNSSPQSSTPLSYDPVGQASSSSPSGDRFFSIVLCAMLIHFVLMVGYGAFLQYRAYRLNNNKNANNNDSTYSNNMTLHFWISKEGRVYNPAIGPNSPTLHLFGVFNPARVLVQGEYWRFFSCIFMNTSLVQLGLNASIIGGLFLFYGDYGGNMIVSNRRGMVSYFVFCLSAFAGGLFCILMACWNQGDYVDGGADVSSVVEITGLASAGLTGVLTFITISILHRAAVGRGENFNYNGFYTMNKGRTYHYNYRLWITRGYPLLGLIFEMANGAFLPFTSFGSIIGGALMGASLGLVHLTSVAGNYYNDDWQDKEEITSTFYHLKTAFEPTINTPPRSSRRFRKELRNYEDRLPPPPPPSSSSKGADTPIMRRSIITSPEDDDEDEFGLMQQLHFGSGMKNRRLNSSHFVNYRDASSPMSTPNKMKSLLHFDDDDVGGVGTFFKFFGVCIGLLLLAVPTFLVGVTLEPPSRQAMMDSFYGCKTLSEMYQYTATDEIDDALMISQNGNTVCGEVCIPVRLLYQFRNDFSLSEMNGDSCVHQDYGCLISNNSIDLDGNFEVLREIYGPVTSNGVCND